jgi:hypothetical protein
MPRTLPPAHARAVTGACLGAISGPDGPTESQLAILGCIAEHLWLLPDVDLSPAAALTAAEAGDAITDEQVRRRTREIMVLLELCRRPLEEAHTLRVEEYCHALGGEGAGIDIVRDYISDGADAAVEDWMRRYMELAPTFMEPAMLEVATQEEAEAAQHLAEVEAALRAAAPATLGAEFLAFYERNGFTIGPESIGLFGHDMCHVIAGYEATPIGEICLGAMQLLVTDNDTHWLQLLASVMIHEAGILLPGYVPHRPPLSDPTNPERGANIEMLGASIERGRASSVDFSVGDHLSMIDWPIADVRAHYGVAPL